MTNGGSAPGADTGGMKTLIVHMQDESTGFLSAIYQDVREKMVLREPVSIASMNTLISSHDRILLLGHGSPDGLFSLDWRNPFVISSANAGALVTKKGSVFIWCHASTFTRTHHLDGFATGMFISEPAEALLYGIPATAFTQQTIDASNTLFATTVGKYLSLPPAAMATQVRKAYKGNCPIIRYNREQIGK